VQWSSDWVLAGPQPAKASATAKTVAKPTNLRTIIFAPKHLMFNKLEDSNFSVQSLAFGVLYRGKAALPSNS
jgi:hypothetical protein